MLLQTRAIWLILLLVLPPAWAGPIESVVTELKMVNADIEATRQFNIGIGFLQDRNLDAAQVAFEKSTAIAPLAIEPLLGLAEVALLRNDADQIEASLQRALAVGPRRVPVLLAWGRWQHVQANFEEAKKAFMRAVQIEPDNARAQFDLADTYMTGLRDYASAEQAYRRVIALTPEHPGAHYALGHSLLMQSRPKEALAAFNQAAKLEPGNVLILTGRGNTYLQLADFSAALRDFDAALEIQAKLFPALLGKSEAHASLGQYKQAIVAIESALVSQPNSAKAQLRAAMLYQQEGRYQDALEAYTAVTTILPGSPLAWNNMAWISAEAEQNLDQAVQWARNAVALEPKNPAYHDTLAWAYFRRGEHDAAIEALNRALELEPGYASAMKHKTIVLRAMEN